MKAAICTKYGPPEVLRVTEIESPVPKNNEVLIKINATSVTASDSIVRGFKLPYWHPIGIMMRLVIGFNKPRNPILGMVLAGEIESAGKDVKLFKPGDAVLAWTIKSPVQTRFGTYAQYKCLPENSIITMKPENFSFDEAAAIPYGGLLSLYFIKKFKLSVNQKVLIYGASGSIGTSAVQLAKYFGANVTGVCSTLNLELVKSLGADQTIDYTKDDVRNIKDKYDFIFDAVGKNKSSKFKSELKELLAPGGKYVSVDSGSPSSRLEDLNLLKELAEAGKLKPVIDRKYPLDQIVEAHRYVDIGHKKGNVIITIDH